jgi:hypothetical protein
VGCDDCAHYWPDVDYFSWQEEDLKVIHYDRHTFDAALLSLSRLAWYTTNTDAAESEDGEDKQQNKNYRGTFHLLKGEKIYK